MSRRYRSEHDLEREAMDREAWRVEQAMDDYLAELLPPHVVEHDGQEGYDPDLDDPNHYRREDPYDNPPQDELERRGVRGFE